ncbi:MAG: hypothetical protein ACFFDN_41310, partial [Candidatus Hodarchaeota archaeon]
MKSKYLVIIIGLTITSLSLFFLEFYIFNSFYWSFLVTIGAILNVAHYLTHKLNWELDTKKVLPVYFILSTSLITIEFIITGSFL